MSRFLSLVWSVISGTSVVSWVLLALLGMTCAGVYVQTTRLDRECLAHNATRIELAHVTDQRDQAVAMALRWQDATALAQRSAAALQTQVQAAQERAAEAVLAASQRRVIMATAKPRPQTDREISEVVDNATRAAVAVRLNRPLP